MGKRTGPKVREHPRGGKVPRQGGNPEHNDSQKIVWSLALLQTEGRWGWRAITHFRDDA